VSHILEIRDLKINYGVHEAIHGLDMDIAEGKITAIIGSNGAGKTTIINAISGIVKREGTVIYRGRPLTQKAHRVVREGIVQVPEGRRVFPGLSVEENLRLGAYTVRDKKKIQGLLEQQYELFPRLEERKKQDAGTLSGGEQQMLAISRGLMSHPRVLMLDEPSLGLAPVIVEDVFKHIKRICEDGVTIILVEQNAKKTLCTCDYGYVIENGIKVMEGNGNELLENEEVQHAYLGVDRHEDPQDP
jgi:branched-chain amino acid transport system ATP-binding protein